MQNKIRANTLSGLLLFQEEMKDSYIFHIPHSKNGIPFYDGFNKDLVEAEINLLTDFATDEIFSQPGATKLVFPYSRVFCDVERLDDAQEPMYQVGRGFFYTKTDSGLQLREENNEVKQRVYNEYYLPHHQQLTELVDQKLASPGFAIIIDCHSFADIPFKTDSDQSPDRPDICIGTDDFHTPDWLVREVVLGFENAGYSVKVNAPYSGTIVPLKHYRKEKQVYSIMIEINRKLYMDGLRVDEQQVKELNKVIDRIFDVTEVKL